MGQLIEERPYLERLKRRWTRPSKALEHAGGPGIYAIYLNEEAELPAGAPDMPWVPEVPFYVGATANLHLRFSQQLLMTQVSVLRRNIIAMQTYGGIEDSSIQGIRLRPRNPPRNWHLTDIYDAMLTTWIEKNLTVAWAAARKFKEDERAAIEHLQPAWNFRLNPNRENPWREYLKEGHRKAERLGLYWRELIDGEEEDL